MTVSNICQREVDLAAPNETVQVAGARMKARNVGTLVVVDAERKPLGILTDRDLALRVVAVGASPVELSVRDVMTPDPCTIAADAAIEHALVTMRMHGLRRLVVVADDGELVGVVSVDDVLVWMSSEFKQVTGVITKSSPQVLKRERALKPKATRPKVRA